MVCIEHGIGKCIKYVYLYSDCLCLDFMYMIYEVYNEEVEKVLNIQYWEHCAQ